MKRIELSDFDMIKVQLLMHCFQQQIYLNENELTTLTLLAQKGGSVSLVEFCRELEEIGMYASVQSARNALARLNMEGLLKKSVGGKNKKVVINRLIPLRIEDDFLFYSFVKK